MVILRNVALVAVVIGMMVFWRSVEAPLDIVAQNDEQPGLPIQETVTPTEETMAMPTATLTAAPSVSPTATPSAALTSTPTDVPTLFISPPGLRVPILMYHRIDGLPPNADDLRKSLSISPADFDLQVHFLKDRGFTSISLYDLYDALQGKRQLPPKPVVLTFDDGYADNYINAFPVLKRYGFSGTFFVLTDLVGTGEYMKWEQLREMLAAGMKIEVHGRTHLDLTKLSAAGAASQAQGSKEAIRSHLGVTPMFYCYPSGRYNKDVIDIIKASGYLGATTTVYGSDHNLQKVFELKRVRIDGRESFATFAKKLGENP